MLFNCDTTNYESRYTTNESIPQEIALNSKLIMAVYSAMLFEVGPIHTPLDTNNWPNG